MDEVELNRKIREVQDTVMTDEWYMDMVEKDQDDCTKRLICEVSHKKANGKSLNDVETQIVAIFGEGLGVDTSKTTAVFDSLPKLASTGREEALAVTSSEDVRLLLMIFWP